MVSSWVTALTNYNYAVNLAEYNEKDQYRDFFNFRIDSSNLGEFENFFKIVIETKAFEKYAIIGEVIFWKLNSYKTDRHNKTKNLLKLLSNHENFENFCNDLENLAKSPTKNNFKQFRQSCGQASSFAVPITFLSFFNASQYPMADLYVSEWWKSNKQNFGYITSSEFFPIGAISGEDRYIDNNWEAYLQWTKFCQKYADLLTSKTQKIWRARDVEMAVFNTQKNGGIVLHILDDQKNYSDLQRIQEIKQPKRGEYAGSCPECGHPLIWRESKVTKELYDGCTNYPSCKHKGSRSH